MKKLGIILDSFSGLSKAEYEKMGFEYINQTVILDGKEYKEGIDGTIVDLIDKIVAATDHKTSMPAIGLVVDKYEEVSKKYENVLFIPMPTGMSSTFSTAKMAAADFENIHVVSNRFTGHAAIEAGKVAMKMADDGKSVEEIIKYLEEVSKTSVTYVIPNNVEQLIKGGRLSGVKKFVMQKGKLIPRLYLNQDGKFETKGIKRNFHKAVDSVIEKIIDEIGAANVNDYNWELIHSTGADAIKIGEDALKAHGIKGYKVFTCSAATGAHTGPGSVGYSVYKK